ncbi:Golgi reassembly-stacking protein 2 [Cichlidogyrus casuarinus]|uniref:Golgi reassembly-stacking protein 2 n=1 Tax=Cichlidogyrus casuarinus TaxID=1844966 RepID=A0ABD2QE34_9PLAT
MGNTDSVIPGDGYSGYHVLKVEDNSPGAKAGLQPYFDYIVAINDIPLEAESDTIVKTLRENQDKEVKLTVYSSKTKNCRDLTLFLDSHWGGSGLLGASIRHCPFEGANESVWHVLEVQSRSPADLAGLKSESDYIIGADSVLQSRDDFYDLIENNDGVAVKLYVYSTISDKCREVHLTPNSNWGGPGMLGCDIGYGYLHRIPMVEIENPPTKESVQPPPENSAPTQPPPSYNQVVACEVMPSEAPVTETQQQEIEPEVPSIAATAQQVTPQINFDTQTTPSNFSNPQPHYIPSAYVAPSQVMANADQQSLPQPTYNPYNFYPTGYPYFHAMDPHQQAQLPPFSAPEGMPTQMAPFSAPEGMVPHIAQFMPPPRPMAGAPAPFYQPPPPHNHPHMTGPPLPPFMPMPPQSYPA